MKQITAAVVGLGSIARKAHLPLLTVHPELDIVGLASRTGAQVDELVAQYRLHLQARSFDEILALRPQAVWLLSATQAHPEQAVRLLEAGIAVYMEKPLANDLAGARQVVEAAAGRLLMVGFNRRFAPAYRRALDLFAASGRTPELVQITKHRNGDHSGWSLRQVVMDDAIHIIDFARFIGGDVALRASHCRDGLTAVQLVGKGGMLVQLSQTYGAGAATERVELHGQGLTVIVEEMERLIIREGGAERRESIGGSWTPTLEKRGMAAAHRHFLDCLKQGTRPDTSAAEALRTQELAEAILLGGAS